MKEETKKILITLLVIIMISIIGYFGYQYYKKGTPKEGSKTEETEPQEEIVIRELTEKYNALTNWNKNIHYTIQLQDLLVNPDKPVLFTGSVDDVFIKDDQYYVRFITGGLWSQEFSESQVYFVLKCDSNKVSEIINRITKSDTTTLFLGSFFDNYVVVAEIENVTKPILQISGYSGYESEEVELEYEPSSIFIATGTCVDFIYIEEDDDDKFNE